MMVGVIIVVIATNIHLRLKYKNINNLRMHEPKELKELRRNIKVWERAAGKIPPYSKDANIVRETLMKKVRLLRHELKKKMTKGSVPEDLYRSTLEELQKEHPIKNKGLLIKCGVVCAFIISLFFLESIPELRRMSSGWAALLGVMLLLIISDKYASGKINIEDNVNLTLLAGTTWTPFCRESNGQRCSSSPPCSR